MEEYDRLWQMGDGGQGKVYRVVHRKTRKEYALKMIRCRDQDQVNYAFREIKVLSQLRHRHIVSYVDFFLYFEGSGANNKHQTDKGPAQPSNMCVCLVMELCDSGDISDVVKECTSTFMEVAKHAIPEERIAEWLFQCADALGYLHNAGFLHRDMKPTNVFFTQQREQIKLGDFGLATSVGQFGTQSHVGTPYYLAPEQLLRQSYSHKVDVWGLGVVFLELLTLRSRPVNSELLENASAADSVVKDITRMGFSNTMAVLVRDMLQRSPEARPTPRTIMQRLIASGSYSNLAPTAGPSITGGRAVSQGSSISDGTARSPSARARSLSPEEAYVPPPPPNDKVELPPGATVCDLCGVYAATLTCAECDNEAYCPSCDDMKHRNRRRKDHYRSALQPNPSPTGDLPPLGAPRAYQASPKRPNLPRPTPLVVDTDEQRSEVPMPQQLGGSRVVSPGCGAAMMSNGSFPRVGSVGSALANGSASSLPDASPTPRETSPTLGNYYPLPPQATFSSATQQASSGSNVHSRAPSPTVRPSPIVIAVPSSHAPTISSALALVGEVGISGGGAKSTVRIELASGVYRESFTVVREGVEIVGQGPGRPQLCFSRPVGIQVAASNFSMSGIDMVQNCGPDAVVADDGGKADSQQSKKERPSVILVTSGSSITIERCTVKASSGFGISCYGEGTQVAINRCTITDAHQAGIYAGHGAKVTLTGNDVASCDYAGILVKRRSVVSALDNNIHDNRQTGIYLHESSGLLERNLITRSGGCGIVLKSRASDVRLAGNTISGSDQVGIFVCEHSCAVVTGNVVDGSAKAGMLIKTHANPTVTKNKIMRSREAGVYVLENGKGLLEENEITSNGSAGILVASQGHPTARRNHISKNSYEGIWVWNDAGGGVFERNDVRGNVKGPKDVRGSTNVVWENNLEQ